MKITFQDKITFVTGGSSGIGLAVARSLAAQGANVWIAARSTDTLKAALKSIRQAARSERQCFGMVPLDVSDYQQVENTWQTIKQQVGVPDYIINCAGVTRPGYIQDLSLDIFREMMEINYFGTVHTVKAALPDLLERGSGHIVNVSSAAGFVGVFGYSAYSPAKFAVTGFSEAIRAELKPHGIKVSLVFPADTDTPQLAFENQYKPPETKALTSNTKVTPPEKTAEDILKGVARGKFIILPGFENKLAYHLNHAWNGLMAMIIDTTVAKVQKHTRR